MTLRDKILETVPWKNNRKELTVIGNLYKKVTNSKTLLNREAELGSTK